MSEREPDNKGFTVIDRRGSASEEPKPSAAPEANSSEAGHAPPTVDFSMLIQSIAISALHYLGRITDPRSGAPAERDLPLARHNIEILELLEAKTRGNLSAAESQLLASLLYEVRMHFVEASKSPSG